MRDRDLENREYANDDYGNSYDFDDYFINNPDKFESHDDHCDYCGSPTGYCNH